ncbi:MAG: AAA family ATPase, partial [Proteobacteria bacterium]|nr:AAA family ATPase [Pseudomonadota bacterium]MBU1545613.1 AAA family ATPase [Pseudomonadota bacterium]
IGTGKTLMLRLMMDDLPDRFETALILSPHLSRLELLLAIFQDIGLPIPTDNTASLDSLLRILNDHLYALAQQGKKLLIVIDEAQNLPDESLEQLRLLSNFETDTQKLLQIVLFGQPELRDKLAQNNMRQLAQRVSIMETLSPLSKQEMVSYILHRFKKSGVYEMPRSFATTDLLWRFTKGYPRLINKIMSRTLLVAYAEKETRISRKIVREAIASLNTPKQKGRFSTLALRWATGFLLLLLLFWGVAFSPLRLTNTISIDRQAISGWIAQGAAWTTSLGEDGERALASWHEQGLAWLNGLINESSQPSQSPQTLPLPAPPSPPSPLPQEEKNDPAPAGEPVAESERLEYPSPFMRGPQ